MTPFMMMVIITVAKAMLPFFVSVRVCVSVKRNEMKTAFLSYLVRDDHR